MSKKTTVYHSYDVDDLKKEESRKITYVNRSYAMPTENTEFKKYEQMMSSPLFASKMEWQDVYEGGSYSHWGGFSWDYYYNDDV